MSAFSTRAQFSRRTLFSGALAGGAAALTAAPAPALIRSGRPNLPHGLQSGDAGAHTATVWARADRPSRMVVEYATRPDFRDARRFSGPPLLGETDFTGKAVLPGLPSGRDVYYRITPYDLADPTLAGQSRTGHLRTASDGARDISFVWSGDLAGQGFGIDTARGGYRIFDRMRELDPDFYLCNGDNIYADDPIEPSITLPDGSIWRNLVTEEKSKVAETLAEYRGNYKYNLLDEPLRRFYAEVAQIQQWDDHETHNNWYPGEILDDPAYREKRVDVLKYRARKAFHEYVPTHPRYDAEGRVYRVLRHGPLLDVFVLDMRWYRDANSANKQRYNNGGILGRRQAEWLKRELAASTATWKIISNDMPLCEVVPDDGGKFEGVAQGDNGAPLGRERQIADILRFLQHNGIRNVVWLTTDVHYTAAHHFDPGKAAFTEFDPFWQFTSGPLHAGSYPPDAVDTTFGAQQVFVKAPPVENASPATEYQFFGQVRIDAVSKALTVRLRDNSGTELWHTELPAHPK
ncbi:alkaline phosphatase D family protein [Sciscionella marina]|uniref:alkaline phosphatase D family protein n=1 Tax=Sciscionella marina TaxID=508770 RepID=UPI0003824A46|nr:alkaline phosphatase D family protein [Sciscionella marina]